jgi:hypothetical protein
MFINGSPLSASVVDDGNHGGYIERFGASLKLPGAPDGPWDGSVSFTLSVKNLKLQALPGFTLAVDLTLKKATVPNFFGQPVNGFTSAFGETPSWNSADLQNTPISGNFHGRWPMFPNVVGDTGARPVSVPNQTAFTAAISVSDASPAGLTLRFSQPLNPGELGIGLDATSSWTTQWAADNASVRIAYASPVEHHRDVTVIVFRAADAAGNMIGGPVRLVVKGRR